MNRKRNLLISLVSALISILLVYLVYQLQLKQIEWQEQIKVVVPKEFIAAGQFISSDMLEYKRILKASYDPRMTTSFDKVVGLEAVIPLSEDEPVLKWKLDQYRLMPNVKQATFQIPRDYILSITNEIRAGDQVKLFISSQGVSKLLFSESITVASVKSSANIEVTDTAQTHLFTKARGDFESLYTSRRNANATIHEINLNLTEKQWLTLDQACQDGVKLVIAYTPSQLSDPAS